MSHPLLLSWQFFSSAFTHLGLIFILELSMFAQTFQDDDIVEFSSKILLRLISTLPRLLNKSHTTCLDHQTVE